MCGKFSFSIEQEKGSVIENRHSGIPTMKREMKKYNLPEPEFYEERGSFKLIFRNKVVKNSNISGQQSGQQINSLLEYKKMLLNYCITPKSAKQIREFLNIKSRNYVNDNIIKPLISEGLLNYTNRNHLNASNQKYISINNTIDNY